MNDHEEAIAIGRNSLGNINELFGINGWGSIDLYDEDATKCITAHNL